MWDSNSLISVSETRTGCIQGELKWACSGAERSCGAHRRPLIPRAIISKQKFRYKSGYSVVEAHFIIDNGDVI